MITRPVSVFVDRDQTSEGNAFDAVLGVTTWEDFPGIIRETLDGPWTVIRYEYSSPVMRGNIATVHHFIRVEEIDETPRVELMRQSRDRS